MQMMVTCDYRQFKAALNAALAVASSEPFDVVRLYPQLELCRLGIAAASPKSIFISYLDLELMKESAFEVEVVEVSVQDAKALKALPIRALDDETPMVGITFYDDKVELTDETGLGLGIRKISVRRQSPTDSVANLAEASDRALAMEYTDSLPLHKEQAALLSKVLSCLKASAKLSYRQIEPGVSKLRAVGSTFLLTVQAGKAKKEVGKPTLAHQDTRQGPILEIARPTGGIA